MAKQYYLETEQYLRYMLAERMGEKKIDVYRGTPKMWQMIKENVYGKGTSICKHHVG